MKEQIRFVLKGGEVLRYHTIRTLQQDSVGYHSFGVAWFVWFLRPESRTMLIMAALAHDLAEHKTGDLPAPTKRELGIGPQFAALEEGILRHIGLHFELDKEEERILKLADCAQGALFCTRERSLGNRGVDVVWARYIEYIRERLMDEPKEQELLDTLLQLWQEAQNGEL